MRWRLRTYEVKRKRETRKEEGATISAAIEEADESTFWLSLLGRAGIAAARDTQPLIDEADE